MREQPDPYRIINSSQQGWSIRGYEEGDIYATIFCPHGRPVEVINTDKRPINTSAALRQWLRENPPSQRSNYCYH